MYQFDKLLKVYFVINASLHWVAACRMHKFKLTNCINTFALIIILHSFIVHYHFLLLFYRSLLILHHTEFSTQCICAQLKQQWWRTLDVVFTILVFYSPRLCITNNRQFWPSLHFHSYATVYLFFAVVLSSWTTCNTIFCKSLLLYLAFICFQYLHLDEFTLWLHQPIYSLHDLQSVSLCIISLFLSLALHFDLYMSH
jgi:hypothetical protein